MATVALVLPTYNEAGNLPAMIEELEALPLSDHLRITIVDDNSPDGTGEVARALSAKYAGISVISRYENRGLGSAIRHGLEACLAERCDYIMTMDADFSHDPADLPRLLHAAVSQNADLVIGSRYISGGKTVNWDWSRRIRSRIANLMACRLLGTPNESTTNYRVYSARAAQLVVDRSTANDYEFQVESMLLVMSRRMAVAEVPITFANRTLGESKLGWAQILKWGSFFLSALALYRLKKGKYANATAQAPQYQ